MPTGRNCRTLPSQVPISQVPKCGVILTFYLTYSSKIALTFEPILQLGCPLIFRIYNKCERSSILWLKAPSLTMLVWRPKGIFTKYLSVNYLIKEIFLSSPCPCGLILTHNLHMFLDILEPKEGEHFCSWLMLSPQALCSGGGRRKLLLDGAVDL